MGTLNFGLAMVAARIASIETEKEQEIRNLRESRESNRERENLPYSNKPSLAGVKLEVNKGELVLIPAVQSPGRNRGERSPSKKREGKIVRIERAQPVRQFNEE